MRTIRIVAVTKDSDLRRLLDAMPPDRDLRVQAACASSPAQANGILHDEDTRLVLLDDTADASIVRLAKRVRATRPDISILCVLSRPDAGLEVRLRQAGVLYLFVRPTDHRLLAKIIYNALHSDTRRYYKRGTPPLGVPALPTAMEA